MILIQVALLAGLAVFFKFYLPHRQRAMAARQAASRERKIDALFQNSVEKDAKEEIAVPLGGTVVKRHPQQLRVTLSPQEVESSLGAPDSSTTDFRGGQHLAWFGTEHKLEAAFNVGKLYCLTFVDRTTGHGEMVFASPYQWRPF